MTRLRLGEIESGQCDELAVTGFARRSHGLLEQRLRPSHVTTIERRAAEVDQRRGFTTPVARALKAAVRFGESALCGAELTLLGERRSDVLQREPPHLRIRARIENALEERDTLAEVPAAHEHVAFGDECMRNEAGISCPDGESLRFTRRLERRVPLRAGAAHVGKASESFRGNDWLTCLRRLGERSQRTVQRTDLVSADAVLDQ